MKTKVSILFFLLLSILFLHKLDKKQFHSPKYAINKNHIVDNSSLNFINNNFLQDDADSKLLNDVIQDDQVDEDDESCETNTLHTLYNKALSFLNTDAITNLCSNHIASVVETQSSKKYLLFRVFRI